MPDIACIVRHNLLDARFYEQLLSESRLLQGLEASIHQISPGSLFLLPDLYYLLYKKVLYIEQPVPSSLHGLIIEEFSQQSGLMKLRTRTAGSRSETHVALWVLTRDLLERLRGASWVKECTELLSVMQDSAQTFDSGPREGQIPDKPDFSQDFWKDILTERSYGALSLITSFMKQENDIAEQVDTLEDLTDQILRSAASTEGKRGPLTRKAFEKSKEAAAVSDSPLDSFLETAAEEMKNEKADSPDHSASKDTSDTIPIGNSLKPAPATDSVSVKLNEVGNSLKKASDEARRRLTGLSPGTWRSRNERFLIPPQEGPDVRRILATGAPDTSKAPIASGFETDQTLFPTTENTALKSPAGIQKTNLPSTSLLMQKDILLKKVRKHLENISAATLFDHAVTKVDQLNELMAHVGTKPQEMDTLSFDDTISLYKRTMDPQIVRFFNKVGQKREIAKLAQHRKKARRDLPVDKIRPDDDLDSIIDDEFTDLAIGIDAFENSFIDRFLHKSLLTRARITRTARHKGPIILCYDGSGSMEGEKILETKAHILAFIEVARRQKRRMITIQFASASEPLFVREIHPSNIRLPDILELVDTFIRGGTDFEKPLKEAIKYLETDRFRNGDILFITDGICDISETFKRRFLASKADKKFHLYAVIIHGNTYQDYGDLSDIADEVLEIRQRDMSDWNQGVSEKIFSI